MIKKHIEEWLGFNKERSTLESGLIDSDRVIVNLRNEILRLKAENLRKDALIRKNVEVLDPRSADPEPQDTTSRRDYVAQVANFFDGIGERKVLHMIAEVRERLDDVWISVPPTGMSRYDYDNFLRGTSNAFKILLDWADIMRGEHAQNIKPIIPNE